MQKYCPKLIKSTKRICLLVWLIYLLPKVSYAVTFGNPLGSWVDPDEIVGHVVKRVLEVLGVGAIIMLIYAGIMWMISQGNQEKTEKAKKILLWTSIGLAIILGSYGITQLVFTKLITFSTG